MKLLVKGIIIGLAKIIPGVSGSLVALNLGLYEQGIKSLSSFFKNVKYNIYFLTNVGIGILIAIIFGSNVINILLTHHYTLTMVVFIGLLVGSDINILKTTKTKKEYLYMIISFLIMVSLFTIRTNINYEYKDNLLNNIYVIFLGFIDASTMIIPAISGTVIFMIIGSYNFILNIFSNLLSNLKITFLFAVGLFIGIILVTKFINKLLNKKEIFYPIINGFFLSSMLFLIIEVIKKSTVREIFISIPLFIISYKIGLLSDTNA